MEAAQKEIKKLENICAKLEEEIQEKYDKLKLEYDW
jgi:hypothetical protein